jgi:sulfoxide reductase heme-binding subunit YedZ
MTLAMLPWVISRATGFTAYAMLTGAMIAGLLVRTREGVGRLKGADAVALHRMLSIGALVLTAIHGSALLLDATIDVPPWALVVPGLIPYRPEWTGIGVIAAEVMLLVHVSFRLRKKIGTKAWRRIHWLAYLAFAGATAHGLASGTDSGRTWALAIYAGAAAAVTALTGWRAVTARKTKRKKARTPDVRQHRPVGATADTA